MFTPTTRTALRLYGLAAGMAGVLHLALADEPAPIEPAPEIEQAVSAEPVASDDSLKVQEMGGVTFISGGVGDQEQQALRAMEKDFNLKLVFAMENGTFLSDVMVTIRNQQGETILSAMSNGPWFYARLEPGTYQVSVSGFDEEHQETVQVQEGSQKELVFRWS